ncbi:hypothetical protein Pint_27157 [Pistacia integerrima]|uniref:Uncharacterized protein n=1 Tax=Pistacia integerrima TaxID=434235 RepID=A0ACC0YS26_9ROSI|nr:hypothetical protein Pint_27157 [Pistacia integerrima]
MEYLQDYSLETECFLQEEDPISANTIPGDEILGNENLKRLLQIETELMDFASISQDTLNSSPGNFPGKEVSPGMVQATEEKVLKGIQEELNEESSVTDLLVMGAEAVEAQNWVLSLAIVLQELSPYVQFAHFTTNQAILEATEGDQEIHVIDFAIMGGIQWPPLMVDLASRKNVVSFRVTAIITDQKNSIFVHQTKPVYAQEGPMPYLNFKIFVYFIFLRVLSQQYKHMNKNI